MISVSNVKKKITPMIGKLKERNLENKDKIISGAKKIIGGIFKPVVNS